MHGKRMAWTEKTQILTSFCSFRYLHTPKDIYILGMYKRRILDEHRDTPDSYDIQIATSQFDHNQQNRDIFINRNGARKTRPTMDLAAAAPISGQVCLSRDEMCGADWWLFCALCAAADISNIPQKVARFLFRPMRCRQRAAVHPWRRQMKYGSTWPH